MLHGYNEGIDWRGSKKNNSILNVTEWQILSKRIAMTSMKKRRFHKHIHSRTQKRNAVKKKRTSGSKTQMKCLVTKGTTNPNLATWYLSAPDRGSENGQWSFFFPIKTVFLHVQTLGNTQKASQQSTSAGSNSSSLFGEQMRNTPAAFQAFPVLVHNHLLILYSKYTFNI